MRVSGSLRRRAASLLTLLAAASLVFAQQPRTPAPAPTKPATPAATRAVPTSPAARPRPDARESADAANVTLDTMFGADSFAVYGEMRGVGQYVSSEEFRQMLEPLRLPGSMPAEMTDLIDFLTAHAEPLSAARLAFGAMPVADGLPNFVAAIEMPSSEEAQKLEPQIRQFVASYSAAHTGVFGESGGDAAPRARATSRSAAGGGATLSSSTRANDPAGVRATGARGAQQQQQQARQSRQGAQTVRVGERAPAEAVAPYAIKRAGAVVALADKQFTFRQLRGAESAPALLNEPGFAAARARLSTDTLFLYFNTTRMSRYTKRQMEESERRYRQIEADEVARVNGANGGSGAAVTSVEINSKTRIAAAVSDPVLVPPDTRAVPYGDPHTNGNSNSNSNSGAVVAPQAVVVNGNAAVLGSSSGDKLMTPEQQAEREARIAEFREARRKEEEAERERRAQPGYEEEQRRQEFESQLGRAVFSGDVGQGGWAESIGVGASLEGDALVVRALFYSESDAAPARPIPFVPILLSGPPVAPEAASVLPADSDIYLSASLDLPQMYDYVASVFKIFDAAAGASGDTDRLGLFDKQISSFEQQGKFRIKEDLLNSLGNEIAVALPGEYFNLHRTRKRAKPKPSASSSTNDAQPQDEPAGQTSPVIVISLKDKKTVEGILPRALEAAGVGGVGESQLFVKRGDADVLAFGGGSAAFIGNFLVVSFDPRSLDWIVDSYNRGETLANSEEFRRASGWQQRQLLGQGYVSNALLADAFADVHASVDDLDDAALRAYVARIDPNPGAVSYSLERDGASLFHELHVPKNLLALMSASSLVAEQTAAMRRNEIMAVGMLSQLASGEQRAKSKGGSYVPLEQVPWAFAYVSRDGQPRAERRLPKVEGYDLALTYSGDKFEITATPNGYPRQGRRSFYVDQTNVVRGGDTGGKRATAENDPVSQ